MDWQPARDSRQQWQRYTIITAVVLVGIIGVVAVAAQPSAGQTDLTLDSLDVAGVNQTVDGEVSDVTLSTELDYQHDVPDAERRIITLWVGPSEDSLEQLTFAQESISGDPASGTVELSGSVFDHSEIDAQTVAPELAETKETDLVVQARVEIRRSGGESVVHNVTDTTTLRLTDGAELTATVGGTGDLTVITA